MDTERATLLEHPVRPRSGLDLLRGDPAAVAIITDDAWISYAELRQLVERRSHQLRSGRPGGNRLGGDRRLVLIEAENTLEPLVTYLAALESGHVALLVPPDAPGDFLQRYDPDVVHAAGSSEPTQRRAGSLHDLHPDLALLLPTSGSTGLPKLVRLSRRNLESNAENIAHYLRLTSADRAITALPFSYCYGLSVIHSHLMSGAGLRLTTRSVREPEFWRELEDAACTSFAGVPYTFDLLDAAGFAERRLPSLRYITQAGGRLDPERVRHYARVGARNGFDFVVMYGQTEATARMAYLPANLAERRAGMIGVPIPGGELRIEAPGDDGVGELIYRGENVMMGYAEAVGDLASGSTVAELRTGDLARRHGDGLFEVVGRVSRFVKVFGLRIDLDRVQQLLAEEGVEVRAIGMGERLVLAVRTAELLGPATAAASRRLGLPTHAIETRLVEDFPRTSSGKPDWAALATLVAASPAAGNGRLSRAEARTPESLRSLYAELLERPDAGLDDSFSSLDGDSLSYVEVSVRLEELLGPLPRDWPSLSVRQLAALATPPGGSGTPARARLARVETSLLLRAVGIVLVVGTHANLLGVQGGAHLLLAVLGFNLARFQLTDASPAARARSLLRTAAGIAVPAVLWIGGVAAITGMYQPSTVLLVNDLLGGGDRWTIQWQYWFLEVAVWSIVVLAATAAVPKLTRLEQRHPFGIATTAFAVAMALRLAITGIEAGSVERYSLAVTAWLVALGWVIARASTARTRILAALFIAAAVPGFFGDPLREGVVAAGLLLLLWVPAIPMPRLLVPAVRLIAAASLFVYLVHWQVYPWLEDDFPVLATLASFAAGIVVWRFHRLAKNAVAALDARARAALASRRALRSRRP